MPIPPRGPSSRSLISLRNGSKRIVLHARAARSAGFSARRSLPRRSIKKVIVEILDMPFARVRELPFRATLATPVDRGDGKTPRQKLLENLGVFFKKFGASLQQEHSAQGLCFRVDKDRTQLDPVRCLDHRDLGVGREGEAVGRRDEMIKHRQATREVRYPLNSQVNA